MIPYKPNLETAVPRTLETRLEIAKAVQALAAQDDGERLRQRRAEIASVRRELEEIARDVRKLRHEWPLLIYSELRKAGYDPNEPRAPAGNPDGGRWTNGGIGDFAVDTGNSNDVHDDTATADGEAAPSASSDIQIAAAGGLRCDGFSGGCQTGGSYGTTALYNVFGRNLCMDCAVKMLGIQNDSSSEKVLKLSPHLIDK